MRIASTSSMPRLVSHINDLQWEEIPFFQQFWIFGGRRGRRTCSTAGEYKVAIMMTNDDDDDHDGDGDDHDGHDVRDYHDHHQGWPVPVLWILWSEMVHGGFLRSCQYLFHGNLINTKTQIQRQLCKCQYHEELRIKLIGKKKKEIPSLSSPWPKVGSPSSIYLHWMDSSLSSKTEDNP